ncbi:MAG: DUF4388 domain-containing protein, partial [Candidatus Obscuribacterales bacterium]
MIEGDLADVSLPGLLQCLATESNKSFRVQLVSGPQKGELIVCEGEILAANFGLLEGNDALTEFLFWGEGAFKVERFDLADDATFSRSLTIALRQLNSFADQILFLQKANVGLNTEIVPSPKFGTQEWQEALQKLPLYKEDYVVLGWVTDGRTMRQAMREFNFDVVQATSSLFRLLSTGSVDCIRPQLVAELEEAEVKEEGAVTSLVQEPVAEPVSAPEPVIETPVKEKPSKAKKSDSTSSTSSSTTNNSVPKEKTPEPDLLPEFDMVEEAPAIAEKVAIEVSQATVVQDFAPPPVPAGSGMGTSMDTSMGASTGTSMGEDVITSDSLPAVGSPEFMELMTKAQHVGAAEAVKTPTTVLEKPKAEVIEAEP